MSRINNFCNSLKKKKKEHALEKQEETWTHCKRRYPGGQKNEKLSQELQIKATVI